MSFKMSRCWHVSSCISQPPLMPQRLGQGKTIAATPEAHRSLQQKTGLVTIYFYTHLSQELLLERCDAHRMGEPSTEDMPQVLAGVLRSGMTSRSAETRPRCASSSISFSATFNGPIVARLMCSMGEDIGRSGPASCSSVSVNTLIVQEDYTRQSAFCKHAKSSASSSIEKGSRRIHKRSHAHSLIRI